MMDVRDRSLASILFMPTHSAVRACDETRPQPKHVLCRGLDLGLSMCVSNSGVSWWHCTCIACFPFARI